MLFRTAVLVCFSLTLAAGSLAEGALPTVEQALGLRPTQKDVNYDTPAAKEIPDCSIKSEDVGGGSVRCMISELF